MRNQTRVTEEQEALQRWKSLPGLEHELPTGTCMHLYSSHETTSYYTCAWKKYSKTCLSSSHFPSYFCFFISFDVMHCTSLIHQPAYFKVNNFTLVYVFLSVNHYCVFSWPLIIFSSLSAVHPALSLLQPSTGEKETREGWVKIDTIAADKSFSKVEPSSPHQYQPNRYSRINIKTRSFAPLTRNG